MAVTEVDIEDLNGTVAALEMAIRRMKRKDKFLVGHLEKLLVDIKPTRLLGIEWGPSDGMYLQSEAEQQNRIKAAYDYAETNAFVGYVTLYNMELLMKGTSDEEKH